MQAVDRNTNGGEGDLLQTWGSREWAMATLLQAHPLEVDQGSWCPLHTMSDFHYNRTKGEGCQSKIVLPSITLFKCTWVGILCFRVLICFRNTGTTNHIGFKFNCNFISTVPLSTRKVLSSHMWLLTNFGRCRFRTFPSSWQVLPG